jgi:threonine dehydrogenase-like Zn-dependent dehydrogenase
MKALLFERKVARFAAAAVAGVLRPGGGASVGPLRLTDVDEPELPTPEWQRLRPRLAGICGSDLATIDGQSSRYFEPIVSFPFVPGHEVVGDLDDGTRAVLVPVLHCAVRGVTPVCPSCAAGHTNRCERIAFGHLEPGLQSGFCEDTGGGWSVAMVAHPDQLVAVPDGMSDEAAVLVEPTACAVHAAAAVGEGTVAVLGAGAIGLLVTAALGDRVDVVAAKHPHQKALAKAFGARMVVEPGEVEGTVRRRSGSMLLGDQLTGGTDWVLDCVGSAESIQQALRIVAPGGTVLVVGMPGHTSLDLTGLWHRETALRGVYAYRRDDFDTAIALVNDRDLGRLLSATYPLARHVDAVRHAAEAGRRGAVKIAFDLRLEKGRNA